MDLIFNPNKFFYDLLLLFANIVDGAVAVCNTICGIPQGENGTSVLVNLVDFNTEEGNAVLAIFISLAAITAFLGLMFAMAKSFSVKSEEGIGTLQPYKDYAKGIAWIIAIFTFFVLAVMLVGQIGQVIMTEFNSGMSLGESIMQNCFDVSANPKDKTNWDAAWTAPGIPEWKELRDASKGIAGSFNAWSGIVGIGVITFPMISIVLYMARRLLNVLILFVISPLSFAMYPLDGGLAKEEWFKDMKGALLGGVVLMIMLQVFILLSKSLMSVGESLNVSGTAKMVYQSIILGAGAGVLLPITKSLLKYFGCEDNMMATVGGSFSPGRAIGAIKRGASNVSAKFKNRKAASSTKGGATGRDGGVVSDSAATNARLIALDKQVATSRTAAMQKRMAANAQRKPAISGGAGTGGTAGGTAVDSASGIGSGVDSLKKPTMAYEKPTKAVGKLRKHGVDGAEEAAKTPKRYKPKIAKTIPASQTRTKPLNSRSIKGLKGGKLVVDLKADKLTRALDVFAKKLEKSQDKDSVKKVKHMDKPNMVKAPLQDKKAIGVIPGMAKRDSNGGKTAQPQQFKIVAKRSVPQRTAEQGTNRAGTVHKIDNTKINASVTNRVTNTTAGKGSNASTNAKLNEVLTNVKSANKAARRTQSSIDKLKKK